MTNDKTSLDPDLIRAAALNYDRALIHEKRIRAALAQEVQTTIPVLGACTTNNGGIISWKSLVRYVTAGISPQSRRFYGSAFKYWRENHLVTCIPAAGAASRFLGTIQKFALEVERLAPQLKNVAGTFFSANTKISLPYEERKSMQNALLHIKIEGEMAELYDKLTLQKHQKVKTAAQNLYHFLAELITKSEPAKVFMADLRDADEPLPEFPSNLIRQPWSHLDEDDNFPHITDRFKAIKSVESETEGRFANTDWLTRLESETPFSKPDEPQDLFLGYQETSVLSAYASAKTLLHFYGALPKALVPTTNEGDSFLKLKVAEQLRLFPCAGNYLISPAGQQARFSTEVSKQGRELQSNFSNIFDLENSPFAPDWLNTDKTIKGNWHVVEQGKDLSTLRFELSGKPFVDQNGQYSTVAAGHGELVHLFDKIAEMSPEAECVHIRNIDNIVGTAANRTSELAIPAQAFRIIRDSLEVLRGKTEDFLKTQSDSQNSDLVLADTDAFKAFRFLANLVDTPLQNEGISKCQNKTGQFIGLTREAIHLVLGNLFHWERDVGTSSGLSDWQRTLEFLSKPLSVFGVVRKEVGDVGGGPVFSRLPDGQYIKLCMEMPHANDEDSREYFGPKGRATHFNPVLVFFELKTHCRSYTPHPQPGRKVDFSQLFDDRFWLMTKREYQGKPVCYHETVLYELIGNSATTNLIFVEVPRTLFNPHKTIFESLGQDRRSYGFDETLKSTEGNA